MANAAAAAAPQPVDHFITVGAPAPPGLRESFNNVLRNNPDFVLPPRAMPPLRGERVFKEWLPMPLSQTLITNPDTSIAPLICRSHPIHIAPQSVELEDCPSSIWYGGQEETWYTRYRLPHQRERIYHVTGYAPDYKFPDLPVMQANAPSYFPQFDGDRLSAVDGRTYYPSAPYEAMCDLAPIDSWDPNVLNTDYNQITFYMMSGALPLKAAYNAAPEHVLHNQTVYDVTELYAFSRYLAFTSIADTYITQAGNSPDFEPSCRLQEHVLPEPCPRIPKLYCGTVVLFMYAFPPRVPCIFNDRELKLADETIPMGLVYNLWKRFDMPSAISISWICGEAVINGQTYRWKGNLLSTLKPSLVKAFIKAIVTETQPLPPWKGAHQDKLDTLHKFEHLFLEKGPKHHKWREDHLFPRCPRLGWLLDCDLSLATILPDRFQRRDARFGITRAFFANPDMDIKRATTLKEQMRLAWNHACNDWAPIDPDLLLRRMCIPQYVPKRAKLTRCAPQSDEPPLPKKPKRTYKPANHYDKRRNARKAKQIARQQLRASSLAELEASFELDPSLPRHVRRALAGISRPQPQGLDQYTEKFIKLKAKLKDYFVDSPKIWGALGIVLDIIGAAVFNPFTLAIATGVFVYFIHKHFGALPAVAALLLAIWSSVMLICGVAPNYNLLVACFYAKAQRAVYVGKLACSFIYPMPGVTHRIIKFTDAIEAARFEELNHLLTMKREDETVTILDQLDDKAVVLMPVDAADELTTIQPQNNLDKPQPWGAAIFEAVFGVKTVQEANTQFTFGNNLVKFVKDVITYGTDIFGEIYSHVYGKEYLPPKFRGNVREITRLNEIAIGLINNLQHGGSNLEDPKTRDELLQLTIDYEKLHLKLAASPPPPTFMASFMNCYKQIKEQAAALSAALRAAQKREAPICMYVYGPPNQGKTFIYRYIARRVMHLLKRKPLSDTEWYPRNVLDPFYSGYSDMKRGISIDDAFQMKDAKVIAMTGQEVVSIVNTEIYMPNMPDLPSKGSVTVHPEFLVLTSNLRHLPESPLWEDAGAIHRRLHYAIEITGYDPNKKGADAAKLVLTHVCGKAIQPIVGFVKICDFIVKHHLSMSTDDSDLLAEVDDLSTSEFERSTHVDVVAPRIPPRQRGPAANLPAAAAMPAAEEPILDDVDIEEKPPKRKKKTRSPPPDPQGVISEYFSEEMLVTVNAPFVATASFFGRIFRSIREAREYAMTTIQLGFYTIKNALSAADRIIRLSWNAVVLGGIALGLTATILTAYGIYKSLRAASTPDVHPDGRGARNTQHVSNFKNALAHYHGQNTAKRANGRNQTHNQMLREKRIRESDRQLGGSGADEDVTFAYWEAKFIEELEDSAMTPALHAHLKTVVPYEDANLSTQLQDLIKARYSKCMVRVTHVSSSNAGTLIDPYTIMIPAHCAPHSPVEPMLVEWMGDVVHVRDYKLVFPVDKADLCFILINHTINPPFLVKDLRPIFPKTADPPTELILLRRFGDLMLSAHVSEAKPAGSVAYQGFTMKTRAYSGIGLSVKGDSGSLYVDPKTGFIQGMHMAGSNNPEDRHVYFYAVDQSIIPPRHSPEIQLPEVQNVEYIPQNMPPHVAFLGKSAMHFHIPTETNFRKSPFFGDPEMLPCKKAPAKLNKSSSGDPLKNSLARTRKKPLFDCGDELMNSVADSIVARLPRPRLPPELTYEQTIKGVPGYNVKPLDMKTSSGPRWSGQGLNPAAKLFAEAPKEIQGAFETLDRSLRSGIPQVFTAAAGLKDELRKLEKVEANDTRGLSIFDKEVSMVARKYFGSFTDAVIAGHQHHPIQLGLNPASPEWQHLHDYIRSFNDDVYDGDWQNFDWSKNPVLFIIRYKVYDKWHRIWFSTTPGFEESHRARMTFVVSGFRVAFLVVSHLMTVAFVTHSGWPLTTQDNSIDQMAIFRLAFVFLTDAQVSTFNRNVAEKAFGDDGLTAPQPNHAARYNMVTIGDWAKINLGMTYTSSDKVSALKPYTALDKATFLKRSFYYCEGRINAPLPVQLLEDSIQWYQVSDEKFETVMSQKVNTYLSEISHYGRPSFDAALLKMQRLCVKYSLPMPVMTYAEALHIRTRLVTY